MGVPSPPGAGPAEAARALGENVLALAGARMELFALELKEEAERRKRQLILAFIAAVFLFACLLLLAFVVVVAFWDTWRMGAIAGVTLVYLAVGAWALLRLRVLLHDNPPAFSATLAEFRNDLDMLRGRDG